MRHAMKTYARAAVPAALIAAALTLIGCGRNEDKPKPVKGKVVAYGKDTCDKENNHGGFANDYTTNSLRALPVAANTARPRPAQKAPTEAPVVKPSSSPSSKKKRGSGRTCYTEYELTVRTTKSEEIECSVTSEVYDLCAGYGKKYPACGARARNKS